VDIAAAEDHVFGLGLLNDWSARDVQAWEYQPLGPFLSKNFATTVSPWIVTLDALEPFRAPFERPAGDPAPLPYLDTPAMRDHGMFDITLEVWLQTAAMHAAGGAPQRISRSSFRDAYWAVAQLVAHHTVNGCNLGAGDLLGSGTISGPQPQQGGSLLELTRGGRQALVLEGGEERRFLEDGDTVLLKAYCERPGRRRIGFGACSGTVLPARRPR
jgi:fumarylacetoacetase